MLEYGSNLVRSAISIPNFTNNDLSKFCQLILCFAIVIKDMNGENQYKPTGGDKLCTETSTQFTKKLIY